MKTIMRAACGCVLLLAGCGFCWGQDDAKPVEATLCDLYQHPEQYAGKMIKVRGGSVGELRIEDILHDSHAERCPTYTRIVVVFPDQVKPAPGFEQVRDESYKKLEKALHYAGPIHIDATYEGRFDAAFAWRDHKRIRVGQYAGKGYGKKHEYDGRIVLHQVSDVWAKPLPRM
jgi:hypothetical protein